jgi:hypothetical protein
MATQSTSTLAPVTEDAFLADRQQFWGSVCHAGVVTVIFLIVLLALMAFFLT